MAKAEWGMKRLCAKCGTRYYDMKKAEPTCPKCGTVFDPETVVRSRRGRLSPAEEARRAVAADIPIVPEVEEDIEAVEDEAGMEDALIEDASELGEESVEDVVEREDDEEA